MSFLATALYNSANCVINFGKRDTGAVNLIFLKGKAQKIILVPHHR